ncbi:MULTISPECIES: haloacid dehalogenase type II [Amycolatopsis methanolica group]|uniref:Haloacid dehalogenase, type II n=2 Tax=Amycolatopsis methanolica group TaxID=2893674 RepID=A0A076MRF9_AMYME|nr:MULTISPECIES: haloacid dehalogenase type II [Amycolatopsis methanolica group]AIJ23468.1 haloacid dehalogenase, type II [Amycolatopsis methanolica 239]ROS44875.1 2-haloacid dehalogenase [Amycolatopsis thermoflava]
MSDFDAGAIRVIACDIFGTTVDWYSGVRDQVAPVFAAAGIDVDAGEFTSAWRDRYLPSMRRVQDGSRDWAVLDTLHRESLDALLDEHGVSLGEDDRRRLVRAWHRLPAWPDAAAGLARLRSRHVVAALSNGGFALLTHLVKDAALPFDCILSAELARDYKPSATVYRTAAGLLDVAPGEVLMVAAHAWDLAGARSAGLRTAFLERPAEKGPHRQADRPGDFPADLVAADFPELAGLLGC